MSTIIKEAAIRQLINEMFDDVDAFIEVPEAPEPVVNVDPAVQGVEVLAQLNPIDPQFKPVDKVQFEHGLSQALQDVPEDILPNLYDKIIKFVTSEMDAYAVSREQEGASAEEKAEKASINKPMNIEGVRRAVQKIVKEAMTKSEKEPTEPLDDYEYTPIEDYDEEAPEGAVGSTLGDLEDAEEDNDDEDLSKRVPHYIDFLNTSGELSLADMKLLRRNPSIVMDLPGFKEYVHHTKTQVN
jgi:hypothetical protein